MALASKNTSVLLKDKLCTCGAVAMHLSEKIKCESFKLFFDDWFLSITLIYKLKYIDSLYRINST